MLLTPFVLIPFVSSCWSVAIRAPPTFCSDLVKDYPLDIDDLKTLNKLVEGSVFSVPERKHSKSRRDIETQPVSACPVHFDYRSPTRMFSMTRRAFRLIVNTDFYEQRVSHRVCKSCGECRNLNAENMGVTTVCRQTYGVVTIVTVNRNKTGLEIDLFRICSGCTCILKS